MDESLVSNQQEDTLQIVAQAPWSPPAPFPLPLLEDLTQIRQPVEPFHLCVVKMEWMELALAMVMDTFALRYVAVWHVVPLSHWTVADPTPVLALAQMALSPIPLSAV